jgi:hypothetical protein
MDGINKTLMKMLGQIGQKNLFIIVVLPSFYDLTRYLALFRCRILFNIYAKGYDDRGYFRAYKTRKNYMYIVYRKFYYYPDKFKDFWGRFSKVYVVDEVEYRKKKAVSLLNFNQKPEKENAKYKEALERKDKMLLRYKTILYNLIKLIQRKKLLKNVEIEKECKIFVTEFITKQETGLKMNINTENETTTAG